MRFWECLVLILIVELLVMPAQALAYLDPSTGSMVLQALVGGVLAAGFTIRLYWRKIRALFRKKTDN